ncbi:MAG: hypothetical protein R3Y58_01165 [Eubacteriales bacterium]
MKRIIGFASFFIATGMVIALMIPNEFVSLIIMLAFLCVSYNLFCCK